MELYEEKGYVNIKFYVNGTEQSINEFVKVFKHLKAKRISNKRALINFTKTKTFNQMITKLNFYINKLNLKYDIKLIFRVEKSRYNKTELFYTTNKQKIEIKTKEDEFIILSFKKSIKIEIYEKIVLVYYISANLEQGFIKKLIAEYDKRNNQLRKFIEDKENVIEDILKDAGVV